jgi:hypothetical protein
VHGTLVSWSMVVTKFIGLYWGRCALAGLAGVARAAAGRERRHSPAEAVDDGIRALLVHSALPPQIVGSAVAVAPRNALKVEDFDAVVAGKRADAVVVCVNVGLRDGVVTAHFAWGVGLRLWPVNEGGLGCATVGQGS